MEIQRLKTGIGLRCWASPEVLPMAAAELLKEAFKQDIIPSVIIFYEPEGNDLEGEIILWGDK